MFNTIKKAYGAGHRAGRTPAPIVYRTNSTSYLKKPENPYKPHHFFLSAVWELGYGDGLGKLVIDRANCHVA